MADRYLIEHDGSPLPVVVNGCPARIAPTGCIIVEIDVEQVAPLDFARFLDAHPEAICLVEGEGAAWPKSST